MTTDLPLASFWRSLQIPPVKPDLHISEKSPALSLASGTVAVNGRPGRRRKFSQLKNQKVLFGPPFREKLQGNPGFSPESFCNPRGPGFPTPIGKNSFAFKIFLLKYF